MMKRKSLIVISLLLFTLTTLAACKDAAVQSPVETPVSTKTITEESKTKVEEAKEAEPEKPVEEKADKALKEEETSTQPTASTEDPEPSEATEATETQVQEPAEEKDPEPQLSALDQLIKDNGIEAYYKDGVFDIEGYGKSIGADLSYLYADCPDFVYLFGNQTWFIQAGQDADHPGKGFILIGRWDTVTYPSWWNCATYSFIFDADSNIPTTGGFSIAKEVLAYLPSVVAATSGPDTAPIVPGTTFKACEYNNAFIQY